MRKRLFLGCFILMLLLPLTGLTAQQNTIPRGTFIGIGTAQTRDQALKNAREDIGSQLSKIAQDMIRDYTASSEVDPMAAIRFQENLTIGIYYSAYDSASVMQLDRGADGLFWAVLILRNNDAIREMNQVQAAAKLAVPAMASFNLLDRWNAAIDSHFRYNFRWYYQ